MPPQAKDIDIENLFTWTTQLAMATVHPTDLRVYRMHQLHAQPSQNQRVAAQQAASSGGFTVSFQLENIS